MTRLSKKQVNVLYANVKAGKLNVEKDFITVCYNFAKDCQIGHVSHSYSILEELYMTAKEMVDAIFTKGIEAAQAIYNEYESKFE